jgi:hypothetical protein
MDADAATDGAGRRAMSRRTARRCGPVRRPGEIRAMIGVVVDAR